MDSAAEKKATDFLGASFNQDCSSLSVASRRGFKLYSLSSTDKLDKIYEMVGEDACMVERLFSSSLVAVVGLTHPRKLRVYHFKKGTEICNYSYSSSILNVKLNRQRLVVVLEESLYIHSIKDMKVIHTIRDTPPNPGGVCAFSSHPDSGYLAFPGSSQVGEVQIFDTINLQSVTMIQAHDGRLAALAFNTNGKKLATASEKGTVIRVFSTDTGSKLYEFRRGVKRYVQIHCLAFSTDGLYLCSSSNTETVHIFKLEGVKDSGKGDEEPQSWIGFMSKALSAPASYLPPQVTDVFSQERSFAVARLASAGTKNVCCITTINKVPRLLVVTAEGIVNVFNIDPDTGGECVLVKRHRLAEGEETDLYFDREMPEAAVATASAALSAGVPSQPEAVSPQSDALPSSDGYDVEAEKDSSGEAQ
ncbi:WD repeat domain phosphoinositide-interacting protein 2-like [Oscarella lobularis]|uniref:WD repeat domain phosphoinositide-interacting protein 2-like n=1 Tax=Oscarella lobularis TaxID=121494 RepID=UPI0033136E92